MSFLAAWRATQEEADRKARNKEFMQEYKQR
jgi:hypothetical protein